MGKHISKDDQMRLIQECRNSGLSDYQWCSLNGISHSTFYRWVTKLRTETCTPVPSKVIPVSEKQEGNRQKKKVRRDNKYRAWL